jgi:hypothetical protein
MTTDTDAASTLELREAADEHAARVALVREAAARGTPSYGPGPDVFVELWAFMADPTGIYLISEGPEGEGGPWLSPRILAYGGKEAYHATAFGLLERHGERDQLRVLHSTGWRPTDAGLVLPYLAVVGEAGGYGPTAGRLTFAYDAYPTYGPAKAPGLGARPVGKPLYDHAGGPQPHGATERPTPRDIDQCWNCLEHARHLRDTNRAVGRALDRHWHEALQDWHGVLGGAPLYGGTMVAGIGLVG